MPLAGLDVAIVPLDLSHAPPMATWMADPAVRDGIGLRSTPTLQTTEDWIRRAQADPTMRPFAILLSGRHVGNVVLDRIDTYLKTVRLSIYLGEASARGSGVGRAALILALREAFHALSAHKVWLTVHVENHRAIAAYLKVGFVLEGIHRDEFLLDGRRLAAVYMGLFRDDFQRWDRRTATEAAR